MRTHTTYTDIRRIMKLHTDGFTPEQISQDIFVSPAQISKVIAVKFPKKRVHRKKTETETSEVESDEQAT